MEDVIYAERGGIRVGDHEDWFNQINATWPFARLILSKDFLEISYPWKKCFRFSREEIHAIEIRWGFPSNGIRIRHSIYSILFEQLLKVGLYRAFVC